MGERSVRDIHLDLERHRKAGTLTPEVRDALLEEERAMSLGGVLECGTPWLLDIARTDVE